MLFNSIDYLLFFPVALSVYFLLPYKVRYIWLLACSYYFYMGWNPAYALLLLASTTITYTFGRLIDYSNRRSNSDKMTSQFNRFLLVICVLINLGMLVYFKYMNFFVNIIAGIVQRLGFSVALPRFDIVLPVGISFFVFQALGYAIDVYRGDIYAERNFLRYALFVSFFPQLVAGPIERSKNLLVQLSTPRKFDFDNLIKGIVIILYGLFLKMVIADRAALIVNTVYNDWEAYPGAYIMIATILFTIQIYCDFYGYSAVAKGSALTMGIHLIDNFNAPFYSKSVKEFWRRWHVSLSGWFRDYVYIPLGGNRKGQIRKNVNLLTTFFLSGLWHGAGFTYITWGILNGGYQVFADVKERVRTLCFGKFNVPQKKRNQPITSEITAQIITFGLICFAFLFFRAPRMRVALQMIKRILTNFNWPMLLNQAMFTLGVDQQHFCVLILCIIILFVVDYQKYKGKCVIDRFFAQGVLFQAAAIVFLITFIIIFGCYGDLYDASEFIYFQF